MKIQRKLYAITIALISCGAYITETDAAVSVTIRDTGGGILVSVSGSVVNPPDFAAGNLVNPFSFITSGGSDSSTDDNFMNFNNIPLGTPVSFFLFNDAVADSPLADLIDLGALEQFTSSNLNSNIGGRFRYSGNAIIVEMSGNTIVSGSFEVSGADFDDAGLVAGTSSWDLDNGDQITVTVVPEPSSVSLLGLGVMVLGVRRKR